MWYKIPVKNKKDVPTYAGLNQVEIYSLFLKYSVVESI
jgi:hypothetical protein